MKRTGNFIGGQHFRAVIVSEMFAGLTRIRAQQLIYAAVQDWTGKEIHAFCMKTFAPGEGAAEEG